MINNQLIFVGVESLCDNCDNPWLLYLCIAFGILFFVMLVINLFLCTAMSCSCTKVQLLLRFAFRTAEYYGSGSISELIPIISPAGSRLWYAYGSGNSFIVRARPEWQFETYQSQSGYDPGNPMNIQSELDLYSETLCSGFFFFI